MVERKAKLKVRFPPDVEVELEAVRQRGVWIHPAPSCRKHKEPQGAWNLKKMLPPILTNPGQKSLPNQLQGRWMHQLLDRKDPTGRKVPKHLRSSGNTQLHKIAKTLKATEMYKLRKNIPGLRVNNTTNQPPVNPERMYIRDRKNMLNRLLKV